MPFKIVIAWLATLSIIAFAITSSAPFAGSGVYCSSTGSPSCHIMTASSSTVAIEQNAVEATGVSLITDRGVGEDIDYLPSKRLIVNVLGRSTPSADPQAFNPYDSYNVLTTKRLAGDGLRELTQNQQTKVINLTTAESPSPDYEKKDTVVLAQKATLMTSLTVDASSGLNAQNAGDVVVVADSINRLIVKANGYDGKNGESPLRGAAKKAVDVSYSDFSTPIPAGISGGYKNRRTTSGPTSVSTLDMDQIDLDNYKDSGLACRADETAVIGVNPASSYAVDEAVTANKPIPPDGIDIVHLGREESKRTLCRRPAAMTAVQSCSADREFSWQIGCSINQEQRSFATFKRAPVKWQRFLCAGDNSSQIRRKIVRQANVTVSIPGGKSYSGLISRTVSFDDSAQVYIPNDKSFFVPGSLEKWIDNSCSNGTGTTQATCTGTWSSNGSLSWFNPFWLQDIDAAQSVIDVASNVTVNNRANGAAYPAADLTNPTRNQSASLSFIPRSGSEVIPTLLFPQTLIPETFINTYTTSPYKVTRSCANLVDLGAYKDSYGIDGAFSDSHPVKPKTGPLKAFGTTGGGPAVGTSAAWQNNPKRYPTIENLLAFDSRDIGFTAQDLALAAGTVSPLGLGVIEVTNCTSFEVMDGVVIGDVAQGQWALISGQPDSVDIPSAPPNVPSCSLLKPQAVGSETFVQYADDQSCYVNDPSNPPSWLKEKLAADHPLTYQNTTILASDIPLDYLSSKAYVSDDVFSGQGFPAGGLPSVSELNQEFIWPSDMTTPQILAVLPADRDGFCVEPDANLVSGSGLPPLVFSAKDHRQKLSRSRLVQKYEIPATSATGVAIPSGTVKKICAAGIRLDYFLAQVPRPTCRTGTSTKQKIGWWSDLASANTWQTWTQKNVAGGALSPQIVGEQYSLKSETIDTRYDDLPPMLLTAATTDVDPSVSIPTNLSSTGRVFPENYGFTKADGSRLYPGWTRESSLINGATVLPADSFSPFVGLDTNIRKAQWCNAPAYELRGGKFLKGFGARGLMRDPAKHVYGFDITKGQGVSQKYVAIEVTGTSEQYGFYMTGDAYPPSLPAKFNSSPTDLSGSVGVLDGLFKKKTYPNIGGRFTEQCAANQSYNQFTGFCHDGDNDTLLTGSWRSSYRTVERYDEKSDRSSWAVLWKVSDLFLSLITSLNAPFTNIVPAPVGGLNINNTINSEHFGRIGLLRPVKDMSSDSSGLDLSIVTNRPETLSKAALGPFFAEPVASADGGICGRRMRMIAVPVPTVSSLVNGALVSVAIEPSSEYLPSGAIFLAADFACTGGTLSEGSTITLSGALIERQSSGSGITMSKLNISPAEGATKIVRDGGDLLSIVFYNILGTPEVRISNIKESMVSGMSATTGFETLTPSAVKIKQRDRATEWTATNHTSGNKGWQQSIRTAPTVPVTDGSITALSCSPENLRGGQWPSTDTGPAPITNASSIASSGGAASDCSVAASSCALNEEELSVFTKAVPDSLTPITTRPGVEQYTPWSFELPASAPRTQNSSSATFNQWTERTADGGGAPTPSCEIFNTSSATDDVMPRTSLDTIPSALKTTNFEAGTIDIKKPGTNDVFISVNLDTDLRKSNSCLEWDQITGQTCLEFAPSVDRADLAPYVFGGLWTQISVATAPRRVSQDCSLFARNPQNNSILTERCFAGLKPFIASQAVCDPTSAISSLCLPCPDVPGGKCAPFMLPKKIPQTTHCKPGLGGCDIETASTIEQVERSVPMPGQSGQSGTDGGAVTVFCGDCGDISVENRGGLGGTGSQTVSSSVSKTLTCVSSNQNVLAPKFFVRQLWSRPFESAGNGQNGVRGLEGGEKRVYSDLTPESLYMISQPEFWKEGTGVIP